MTEIDMKPFTSNAELPEPKMKKGRKGKDGEKAPEVFAAYAEARYFMRMTPVSYEMIKVFKKPHGILRKHCFTLKRSNKAHMAQFKKYKEAGIPVLA